MIRKGEGHYVEFKQSIPSKVTELAEEICAFANTEGGVVLVGVNDKGQITGIELDNVMRSRLQHAIGTIEPAVPVNISELNTEDGKTVLCLECATGNSRPHMVSGRIIVRNGPNSEKLVTQEKIWEFFVYCDRILFDQKVCGDFKFPEDFDQDFFKLFLAKAGISTVLSKETVLNNLKLMNGPDHFRNAVVLLFAKDTQRFYTQAITRCVLFKGTNKYKILDDKTYTGNLVQQYEQAYKYIVSKLNLSYIIEGGGPRKEVLEIPETVFKEALINSLCHRDYFEKGAVTMAEIFDDRVVIHNPGGLVTSIKKSDFGRKSFSRNPLVFDMLQRLNMVEKVGSGINRMREEMVAANLPEPEFSLEGMFTVTFYRPLKFSDWIISIQEITSHIQIKILTQININQSVTIREIADELKLSIRTVERNVAKLKEIGFLVRIGSDKAGYYQITKKRV